MKKILPIIIFFATYSVVYAQDPHTIDTIWNREPTYFYQYWFDSADFRNTRKPECKKPLEAYYYSETAKYNYTDSVLKILGVAGAVVTYPVSDIPLPEVPQCADTSFDNWFEFLRLYKPTDTGMVLLAEQRYSALDTARRLRVFHDVSQTVDSVKVAYLPIYEVYFDSAITVTDSFYVASTNYNGVVDSQTMTYPGHPAYTCLYDPWGIRIPCWPQHYKYRWYGNGWQWVHDYNNLLWFIFPIVDTVQPVCRVPQGLQVAGQDSVGVHLVWDSAEHNRLWSIAYGRADADPDGYAECPSATTDLIVADLVPGLEYAARVRAVCFDNNTYSEWSDTIRFVREGEVGIGISDDLRASVIIRPNPAHTSVTVTADATIKSIEIFDMQGHRLLSRKTYGKRAKIVVSNWAKGSYIVHTNTTRGTNIQKMVVE